MAKKVIVCEGRKVKLKHLKKGLIFSLLESQEFIGNFQVLEEINEAGAVLTKSVTPGIGEKKLEVIFTEDDLK